MNQDDLASIAEDIEYLGHRWSKPLSKVDVRHGGAILRRLLVEGGLGKAWRAVGLKKEPKIIAMNLDLLVRNVPLGNLTVAMSIGGPFNGGFILEKGAKASHPGVKCDQFEYSLSGFMNSSGIIIDNYRVSRKDLVKYIANVGGGVHLGGTGKKSEKLLKEKIEKLEASLNKYRKGGLYMEITSIGQCVGLAPDSNLLVNRIRKLT